MAKVETDIMKMDLYDILGIKSDATEKEILKAYRKRALKCHPDKNPDNPKAVELFQQLAKALEIVTDISAKAAYDKLLKAKKATEERNRSLNSKRKKFKEDLEAKEKAADERKAFETQATKNLLTEIERLRKDGSSLLEKEQQFMKEKIYSTLTTEDVEDVDLLPKIKLRWNVRKTECCDQYSEQSVSAIFRKYGKISNVVFSVKKNNSAIVEFEYCNSPHSVVNEIGVHTNPLTVTWLSPPPTMNFTSMSAPQFFHSTAEKSTCFDQTLAEDSRCSRNDRDFESLVLMKMRQAEERKKLIASMENDD